MITFTVSGPPVPKQRARRGKRGRWYTPTKTAAFEESVALMALGEGAKPSTKPVSITMAFHMPDKRRRDLDNCAKSVCDGLNGIAYVDDCQIQVMRLERHLDRENPRTEVTIKYLGEG